MTVLVAAETEVCGNEVVQVRKYRVVNLHKATKQPNVYYQDVLLGVLLCYSTLTSNTKIPHAL